MPVAVALAGAAFSVSAGMALGATTIAGGLMIAGGVASGLGAITGNKKLSKIGGILSIAGGVGSLAQSLASASTTGAGATAADQAAKEAAKAGAGSATKDTVTNTVASDAAAKAAEQAAAAATAPGSTAFDIANGVPYSAGAVTPPSGGGLIDAAMNNPVVQQAGSWLDTAKSGFQNVSSWASKNKEMAQMLGQGVMGAAKAYGEQDAAKRQQSYYDQMRQRYSDSVRNLVIPSPTGLIGGGR